FFFSSRRRHTRWPRDWSSDVCSSDLGDPREEKGTATVALKKPGDPLPGLLVSDMTRDQRELVDKVLADLLLPFRKKDADEAMKRSEERRVGKECRSEWSTDH